MSTCPGGTNPRVPARQGVPQAQASRGQGAKAQASPAQASQAQAQDRARRTIHDLLETARRGLVRLTAQQAYEAVRGGLAVLIDTRSEDQRAAQGYLREARHYPLSVLEWRVCPASGYSDEGIDHGTWVVLICREGYSSSLAAARLQALGFTRATDVIDGVDGWRAAGLPLADPPT